MEDARLAQDASQILALVAVPGIGLKPIQGEVLDPAPRLGNSTAHIQRTSRVAALQTRRQIGAVDQEPPDRLAKPRTERMSIEQILLAGHLPILSRRLHDHASGATGHSAGPTPDDRVVANAIVSPPMSN
jgi:hypothetical protein